jgi:hypothetical protein
MQRIFLMSDFNINISEVAGHAAADLIESFFKSAGNYTADQIAKYKVRLGAGFSKYLTSSLARHSYFKTILNRYEPLRLDAHYVPVRVSIKNNEMREEDFYSQLLENRKIIVEGTAGLGKTLFMRHLFAHTCMYDHARIPILFELRNLQLDSSVALLSHLTKQISTYIPKFSNEHLVFGLQKGRFIIYLDGLDEIAVAERTRYGAEILEICHRYVDVPVVITSRPDKFYEPWEALSIAKLSRMSRGQTSLMLDKLPFESSAKARFLDSLTEEFFDRHREFLAIPLLATLMMMTFEEFSSVPEKLYVFYEQAFQTLFQRHDALKGAYSRKLESGLDIEEFRRVLSAFCFISYVSEQFSFLEYQALENIRLAAELANVEVDAEKYFDDLLVAVCLLQRDGNYLTFIHRSFQEFFAALFAIRQSQSIGTFDLVERLLPRQNADAVLKLMINLDVGVIEQGWVIPKIKEFERRLGGDAGPAMNLKRFFGSVSVSPGEIIIGGDEKHQRDIAALELILGFFQDGSADSLPNFKNEKDRAVLQQYLESQIEAKKQSFRHDRAVVEAYERSHKIPIELLPADIIARLESVGAWSRILMSLSSRRETLESRLASRERQLRGVLSRIRPTGLGLSNEKN